MPFAGGPDISTGTITVPGADTALPFTRTLAAANTAEDFATIPVGKKGMSIALINLGPGSVFIKPDANAALTGSIEVKAKEAYSESGLSVSTRWSFVGETGKQPAIRGVVWAG